MTDLGDRIEKADWKKEKHVPVIDCPDQVKAGEFFEVKVSLEKEIAPPNTPEHHIRWIMLYFRPKGDPFAHEVGRFEFSAHGESARGANQGPVYTHHEVTTSMKINKAGRLHYVAYCNIHGLWEETKEIGLI